MKWNQRLLDAGMGDIVPRMWPHIEGANDFISVRAGGVRSDK